MTWLVADVTRPLLVDDDLAVRAPPLDAPVADVDLVAERLARRLLPEVLAVDVLDREPQRPLPRVVGRRDAR